MWRRHLDGCASLIQSVGINGFSSGLEKALFWCFARMGLCNRACEELGPPKLTFVEMQMFVEASYRPSKLSSQSITGHRKCR